MRPSRMTFRETMSGPFAMGATDPAEGARIGQETDWRLTINVTVTIDDMTAFVTEPRPPAKLTGDVHLPGVSDPIPFEDGTFQLFPNGRGSTLMTYRIRFTRNEKYSTEYELVGAKAAGKVPSLLRLWSDTTTLRVRLYRNPRYSNGQQAGAGVLRLTPTSLAKCLASIRTSHSDSPVAAARTVGNYAWLMTRSLADTYLPGLP
jgi:hypothetical protein